jgi:hypothetical protein
MKTFTNGHQQDKRPIVIKIDKDFIVFYFESELNRFEQKEENEDGYYDDFGEIKEPSYFYWIGVEDWNNIDRHFVEHMNRKAWFTNEMENYINEQLKNK